MPFAADAVDSANSPQVIAAIVAAFAAAGIGILNLGVTIWQGHLTRRASALKESREQWWERFTWAAERIADHSKDDDRNLGTTVMASLANVDWIQPEDKDLIDMVLEDYLTDDVSEADIEEAARGENH